MDKKKVSSEIRAIRAYRGITQSELARRSKCSPTTISQLEAMGKINNLSTLERIVKSLDARIEMEILKDDDHGTP